MISSNLADQACISMLLLANVQICLRLAVCPVALVLLPADLQICQ